MDSRQLELAASALEWTWTVLAALLIVIAWVIMWWAWRGYGRIVGAERQGINGYAKRRNVTAIIFAAIMLAHGAGNFYVGVVALGLPNMPQQWAVAAVFVALHVLWLVMGVRLVLDKLYFDGLPIGEPATVRVRATDSEGKELKMSKVAAIEVRPEVIEHPSVDDAVAESRRAP